MTFKKNKKTKSNAIMSVKRLLQLVEDSIWAGGSRHGDCLRGAICHLLRELWLDSQNKPRAWCYIDHKVLWSVFDAIWSFCRDQCCSCTSSAERYNATGSTGFDICDELAHIYLKRQIQASNFRSNHFWYKKKKLMSDWNGSVCSVEMQECSLLRIHVQFCLINIRFSR